MAICLIALGSNLGDRASALNQAIAQLQAHTQIHALKCSQWLNYPPIGGPEGQPDFINGAARFETTLAPADLLRLLHVIEANLGRERRVRWSARVVDLDLLLYDDLILASEEVHVPHPRMTFRRFVIEPAAEVAGDMTHPVMGWSIQRLLEHLDRARPYIAITGLPRPERTSLARFASETVAAGLVLDPPILPHRQPTLASELSRLEQRTSTLKETFEEGPEETVLSDFWIGQSLVYARQLLNGDDFREFESVYLKCSEELPPPKLLVNIAKPPECQQADATDSTSDTTEDVIDGHALSIALEEPSTCDHCGPTLCLDASQPDWSRTELIAAIRAMQ